jgi:signal transduction histidine kinase
MGGQDPARPLVVAVIGAAQRSAALTRQMLTYSGRGSFQMMDVDLGEHVVAMREILRVAAGRGTEPTFRVTGDRLHVHADPAQLDQLLMNLVINAAEAMGPDEGEIVVEVSSDKLERGYFEGALAGADLGAGRYVRLRVRDTGSGMDPATRQRIFEPFFSSKATGRGLGMAVVHGIVRGHQCAVKVDTALGVGTTFEVLFPAREG